MKQTRTARKAHQCTLCGGEINQGEQYLFSRVTPWDHHENEGFFSYKAHVECDRFWYTSGYAEDHDYMFDEEYHEFREAMAQA